jgi:predicted amidohydrolase
MRRVIRIAQVKAYPARGDLEANHRLLRSLLDRIAPVGPDVVVTPECFLDGYVATEAHVTRENIDNYAVGPEDVSYVADWAALHNAWVVLGCSRLASNGVSNSAFIFDRAGQLAGTYDKVHCREHDVKFVAGDCLPVFESDFGLFGVMICADRVWPETVRTLALQGARIIFNPTYGSDDERNFWKMRTRSSESEIFIAFTHPAQALVTDPTGEVILYETRYEATFAVCEVDLDEADRIRSAEWSQLKTRRPEVYRLG